MTEFFSIKMIVVAVEQVRVGVNVDVRELSLTCWLWGGLSSERGSDYGMRIGCHLHH